MPRRQVETEIDTVGSDESLYSTAIVIGCEWTGDHHKGFPAVPLPLPAKTFSRTFFSGRCNAAAFVFAPDCTRDQLWARIARLFDHTVVAHPLRRNLVQNHPLEKCPIRGLTYFTSADGFSYLLLNVLVPMDFSKMATIGKLIEASMFLPKADFDNRTRLYQYLGALVVEPKLELLNSNELALLVCCVHACVLACLRACVLACLLLLVFAPALRLPRLTPSPSRAGRSGSRRTTARSGAGRTARAASSSACLPRRQRAPARARARPRSEQPSAGAPSRWSRSCRPSRWSSTSGSSGRRQRAAASSFMVPTPVSTLTRRLPCSRSGRFLTGTTSRASMGKPRSTLPKTACSVGRTTSAASGLSV
jgi:hypothetical protein